MRAPAPEDGVRCEKLQGFVEMKREGSALDHGRKKHNDRHRKRHCQTSRDLLIQERDTTNSPGTITGTGGRVKPISALTKAFRGA
jgi:hypothetical protein